MGLTHDETVTAITANDPPIRPGQTWVVKDDDKIIRALRIYALWPEPVKGAGSMGNAWVFSDAPGIKTRQSRTGLDISYVPEYNLRRIFELAPELSVYGSTTPSATPPLELPHRTMIETGPGEAAALQEIKTAADIDRIVRDLHACISTLEGIAYFASGTAGDEAMRQLKRMGVWRESVTNLETGAT